MMTSRFYTYTLFLLALLMVSGLSCNQAIENNNRVSKSKQSLFKDLPATTSGLAFNNHIEEDARVNYFKYVYLYNGAGVGIGDLNNDDLPEIYFTSTQGKDKLFLNKGNMTFEDISEQAGINKYSGQKTGVTMVDLNNDGLLDIYVCRAGWDKNPQNRRNLLFINKGNMHFEEQAAQWGIHDIGHSTQAAFFDYDHDGDLDLFVANHPGEFSQPLTEYIAKINNPDPERSDKLFRNNGNGTFSDVSTQANIVNYGHSLGIAIGDLNQDGWEDIYVTKDFAAHDCYFVNNGDGTFTESLKTYFPHSPYFSMGCDLVDINHDQKLDLFVVEMLSEDNTRQKTNMAPMDMGRFAYMVNSGLHYQYMRNAFQINNGNGYFSDIAHYANIDKTDWSWGTLFGDYDNDGDDDLIVVNGFLKDTQDKDFTNNSNALAKKTQGRLSFDQLNSLLKSTPVQNYAYQNIGQMRFENSSALWGFNFKGFSNGVSYGDLDRDGDLDLVVNNINANASLYENTNNSKNFIAFTLTGPPQNKSAFHTKIKLYTQDGNIRYKDFQTSRGFQSCTEPIIHFGLKPTDLIEKVIVTWPNGKQQTIHSPAKGQYHHLKYEDATELAENIIPNKDTPFKDISAKSPLTFIHKDLYYDDYHREVLLPHQLSQLGPAIATGDVDNNGLTDCYIGGAHNQAAVLWLQLPSGKFIKSSAATWAKDADHEDIDALFFDADGDKDLDLYVVSGSNEYDQGDPILQDRYYQNDGKGNFNKVIKAIPTFAISGACVAADDFDKDGDLDLFVGGRMVPGNYPVPAKSLLLENNNGTFTNVTEEKAPELLQAGLITDAIWTDFNNDQYKDLILVGEWTDIYFYENKNGVFQKVENQSLGLEPQVGWWNCIQAADLDGDGDEDYILGNLGQNYKYQASDEKPFEIYSHDFDDNGQRDIVVGYYAGDKLCPVRGLQCSSEQIPDIKKKFPTYQAFGKATLEDIYGEKLKEAIHYAANNFSSIILWNEGNGIFSSSPLPYQAQWAPIQDMIIKDLNQDKRLDIIIAGNWFVAEIETPRADNGTGLVLLNKGNRTFQPLSVSQSGLFANKDLRGLAWLEGNKENPPLLITANSDDSIQVFQFFKDKLNPLF